MTHTTLRLEPELFEEIQAVARQDGISKSEMIRSLLIEALAMRRAGQRRAA